MNKSAYGEFAHVLLSDEEYASLGREYPNREALIRFLDEYMERKEKKFKNCYMEIKHWVVYAVDEREAKAKAKEKAETPPSVKKGPLNNFNQEIPDSKELEKIILAR